MLQFPVDINATPCHIHICEQCLSLFFPSPAGESPLFTLSANFGAGMELLIYGSPVDVWRFEAANFDG